MSDAAALFHTTILAAFEFQGERYEIWDRQGRLWLAHYRSDQDAWELATLLI